MSIRHRENGRWQVDVTFLGKRYRKDFYSEEEAQQAQSALRERLAKGEPGGFDVLGLETIETDQQIESQSEAQPEVTPEPEARLVEVGEVPEVQPEPKPEPQPIPSRLAPMLPKPVRRIPKPPLFVPQPANVCGPKVVALKDTPTATDEPAKSTSTQS